MSSSGGKYSNISIDSKWLDWNCCKCHLINDFGNWKIAFPVHLHTYVMYSNCHIISAVIMQKLNCSGFSKDCSNAQKNVFFVATNVSFYHLEIRLYSLFAVLLSCRRVQLFEFSKNRQKQNIEIHKKGNCSAKKIRKNQIVFDSEFNIVSS